MTCASTALASGYEPLVTTTGPPPPPAACAGCVRLAIPHSGELRYASESNPSRSLSRSSGPPTLATW